jgi:hypothetical protein
MKRNLGCDPCLNQADPIISKPFSRLATAKAERDYLVPGSIAVRVTSCRQAERMGQESVHSEYFPLLNAVKEMSPALIALAS